MMKLKRLESLIVKIDKTICRGKDTLIPTIVYKKRTKKMGELQYMPLLNSNYFEQLSHYPDIEMQNAIKISLMMVEGFIEILDELNFDEEKLRTLQFNLDDNYDIVEEIFNTIKDKKTKAIVDKLLTQIAKLEMEIGDLILEHHHDN